jgi:hypothetical protein
MSRLLLAVLLFSTFVGTGVAGENSAVIAQAQTPAPDTPQTPRPRSGRDGGDCHHPPVTS